jgi:hypothetical protein
MTNLERIEFLTNKLHDLLSQTQELKEMIEMRDAQNQVAASSEEESVSSATEIIEQKPESRTWCCCFSRKPKLN